MNDLIVPDPVLDARETKLLVALTDDYRKFTSPGRLSKGLATVRKYLANVTPDTAVRTMSGGERQGVAIVRALYFQARLIILDEPTMGLSISETRKALDFVRGIKRAGKACIFIDHNVFHVYPVADRIVVLDRGRVAGEFRKASVTLEELTHRLQQVAQTGSLDGSPAPQG